VGEPNLVLDTSAVFTLLLDEPGAQWVQERLQRARSGKISIFGSFATLTEVDYTTRQAESIERANLYLALISSWPVTWLHSTGDLCRAAARLKAEHAISLADAFVAATALLQRALLVHKDPELMTLKAMVAMETLPFKPVRRR